MKNKPDFLREQKARAHAHCKESVRTRMERILGQLEDIKAGLTAETKSSAGDKHETARAMLHLEREKLGRQLVLLEKENELLNKLAKHQGKAQVGVGSLVKTSQGLYYIAISAGEFKDGEDRVHCVSAPSPIGQALLGGKLHQTLSFRERSFEILGLA
ncbi:3-oxoacyl-ACP synthase [Maribacter sp. 2307ULW6-5]|uniref:3-oxoacyl-ACP synthase n=1 Tax=Maribacter sp. 2307ULW6-5 TaxID=3386275 RepID=UPI0039BC5CEB